MADEMINSYVALDLETTGIGARHEKITEIGMVKVIDGEATDTYHTMVNPHREIPKRIVELTGITDDMVKDARESRRSWMRSWPSPKTSRFSATRSFLTTASSYRPQ